MNIKKHLVLSYKNIQLYILIITYNLDTLKVYSNDRYKCH